MGSTASPGCCEMQPAAQVANKPAIGIGCTGPVYPCTGEIGVVRVSPGGRAETGCGLVSSVWSFGGDGERRGRVALREGLTEQRKEKQPDLRDRRYRYRGGIIRNGRLYRGVDSPTRIGHHVVTPPARPVLRSARLLGVLARGPAMVEWLTVKLKRLSTSQCLTAKRFANWRNRGTG